MKEVYGNKINEEGRENDGHFLPQKTAPDLHTDGKFRLSLLPLPYAGIIQIRL